MALHVPKAPGFVSMLKEGARHYSGLEEAITRNIRACGEFSDTLKSAYGPCGMNKMVVNHLEKLFVTNDAATIVSELEVEHPAAKVIVMASQIQEQEVGDGTNFVILFAGALLNEAEELLQIGLKPTEIASGYELALKKALDILPSLVIQEVKNVKSSDEIYKAIKTAIMSKQHGNEEVIAKLVVDACTSVMDDKNTTFNVDNVRVCKLQGASLLQSEVVKGLVFKRSIETSVKKKENAKVAVYTCPIDVTHTETKGTVLLKTAEELMQFSQGEEALLEKQIKEISDSGANVVVTGGKIGDLALHYLNKYELLAVRLLSKFDLRRVAKATNASASPKLEKLNAEDLGFADEVYLDEFGDTPVVVFKIGGKESRISSIVLRGATENFMDDVERAINDGINTYRILARDGRLLPGAGATEIELAKQISDYGETLPGLAQYSVKKFASALESFIKVFCENSGLKSNEVLAKIYASHHEGNKTCGINLDDDGEQTCDASQKGILDTYKGKFWALQYACNAACTILQVDEIIMAKRAGGPKAKPAGPVDED